MRIMSLASHSDTALFSQLATVLSQLPLPVAVVDLETTGGHFEDDRITEIAILRFCHGKISRHQWLINPQKHISQFIVNLTGISNKMVETAPTFDVIAPELLPLLREHLLVAHNSRFDYTFLRYAFARVNIPFATTTLDTVPFSRKLYPEFFKHNLDSIIERFKIDIDAHERHRAIGDVLALSQFLALSLAEKTATPWLKQWNNLVKPTYLPSSLSKTLYQQIYTLPDGPGISMWTYPDSTSVQLQVYEQAFSEITSKLQKKAITPFWQDQQVSMTFIPAISKLHAYFLLGQYRQQYTPALDNLINTEQDKISNHWYTIQFISNHQGQLQPYIKLLNNEEILTQKPYGLFPHRQAAKRALADWTRTHQLCPAVLAITPSSLKKSAPCPRQVMHLCDGHCKLDSAIEAHNQTVLKHAMLLPVCDWGKYHELILTEKNKFNHQSIQLKIQSGFLQLDKNHWYFHFALPKLIKQRLKKSDGMIVLS